MREHAQRIICGSRRRSYGLARKSFERVAVGWSAILEKPVTAHQVALCMAWLKLCREANRHQRDNLIDLAGYAALAQEVVEGASEGEEADERASKGEAS